MPEPETTLSTAVLGPSLPALHAFDPHSTTWQSYRDRIGFYFQVNRIDKDADKKSLLLWAVGDATYHLLESLFSPRSLTDATKTYAAIVKMLNGHYDDKKNIMTSSYDFYSCHQKAGQTFAEWKVELCDKLRHCGFTTSSLANKPQDRALRDMYVIGVRSQKIRQALLKEQDPDLETTERIIQLAELLQEDVRHFGSALSRAENTVSRVQGFRPKSKPAPASKATTTTPTVCDSCGSAQQTRNKCRFREYTCNFCKRSGHLERVCRQKRLDRDVAKHVSSIYTVKHTDSTSSCIRLPLVLNNVKVELELDTGSSNTIIDIATWKRIGAPTLSRSQYQLYSGNSLPVKGQCDIAVQYNNRSFNLRMIVVHGDRLPLLRLQWISALQLDLNKLVHGTMSTPPNIRKVQHSALDATLNKY